jgi:hypothetical protein
MSRRPLFPPIFAPTVSRPLVDDFSIRAARLESKQAPNVPLNAALPLRSHPMWSGNNELGIEVPYQPDGDGLQTILKLGEWGPPAIWTISLGLAYSPDLIPSSGDAMFSIDGLIRYGSGGVTQQIDVDWADGVCLAVPMNAVNVIARYSDFTGKNNTPSDLRLRVNLSQGGATANFVTKSSRLLVPTGGLNAQSVLIPKFARRLHVQRGAGALGGAWAALMSYTFFGTDGPAGDAGGFTGNEYLINFAGVGVPIPPSARSLRITNTTGSDEVVLVLFELAA